MAANNRESRRRKILERGSDRLALITGRISSPSTSKFYEDPKANEPHLPDQATVSPPLQCKDEDDLSGSRLPEKDPASDAGHTSAHYNGSSEDPSFSEQGTSTEALGAPASDVNGQVQSSMVSSTDQIGAVATLKEERQLEPQRFQSKLFTSSQIISAITATEHTRLFCSVAVALLVVLSCVGFPLLGNNIIKSLISFRPLYFLLLTNVTIVLSRLLFDNQGGFPMAIRGENNIALTDANGWVEQASKALEVGLLMQKVMDAVFMDCSFYTVIVICGLSFA